MTAGAGEVAAGALDHRGLTYVDRASLVAAAIPLITQALAGGERVVAVVDRATARELGEALTHPDAAHVRYPSPAVLGAHGSPSFTRRLDAWASAGRRLVVLTQYVPGPSPGTDPALETLPITLYCACPRDADVLEAFHTDHDALVAPPPAVDDGATTTLETTIGDAGDLAGIRRGTRRLAVGVGFGGLSLDRTVLAVHEACVLGCDLLRPGGAGDAALTPPDGGPRCSVEVRAVHGSLRAEVVVTGGAGADDTATNLAHVRPFCQEASVHEGPRSRAIRVLALA